MKSSTGWIWVGFLLAGFWYLTAATYPNLPERIPGHFGFDGGVTRWADRSEFWALPAVASGVALLFFVLTRLAFKYPELLNLPNKKLFLSLAQPKQLMVMRRLDSHLAILTGWACIYLAYTQWKVYQVAAGITPSLGGASWLGLAVLALLLGWMIRDINQVLRRVQRTL
ncbi:DUF1648 domain-containing protein [Meiothermus cerbereus]|uniref:DUF1648 domain-containing protein n=1 Tax=Meiothermus cerbereus TaxID=65552 RepID=UPI003EEC198B